MRRISSVLAVTSAFLVLAALPAHAAGCPMLVDAASDSAWVATPVRSPIWDIRSADVATGPTTLVAVLRLTDLSQGDSTRPNDPFFTGTSWLVGWVVGTARHSVELSMNAGAPTAEYEWNDGGTTVATPVPVTLDRAAGTISWTVPRSAVPGLTGATLTNLAARSAYLGSNADLAFSTSTFTDGTPGCVSAA